MKLTYILTAPHMIDGKQFEAGTAIATLETELDPSKALHLILRGIAQLKDEAAAPAPAKGPSKP